MTIHHDKLAYGRLKGLNDEMTADEIAKLVEQLNDDEDDTCDGLDTKTNNVGEKDGQANNKN